MKSAIYGILNLLNGKIYIGSAVDVHSRLRTHKSRLNLNKHPSKHLQGAYNEYGSFAFEFIILEYCNKIELTEREQIWFELTNCYDPKCGYNKRKVATSNLGIKLGPASEARKQKMSEFFKGRVIPQNWIEKSKLKNTGKKRTPEQIAKAIAGRSGYTHSDKTKNKMSVSQRELDKWPHGYKCNCRQCLDKKNLERRLKRYNHEGEFSNEF